MLFLPIFHTPSPYTAIHFALPTKASYFAPQHILSCFEKDYFPSSCKSHPVNDTKFHDRHVVKIKSNFHSHLFLLPLRFSFLNFSKWERKLADIAPSNSGIIISKASYFAPQHILSCFEKDYFPSSCKSYPVNDTKFHNTRSIRRQN